MKNIFIYSLQNLLGIIIFKTSKVTSFWERKGGYNE